MEKQTPKLNPWKTIDYFIEKSNNFKGPYQDNKYRDWEDIYEYDLYSYKLGMTIFVIHSTDDKLGKFFEAIENNSDQYTYNFGDSVLIDYEDNCA